MALRAALVAIVLLSAAVYQPLVDAPFVYEDGHSLHAAVSWAVPSRALAVASMQWTADSASAHAVNVGLHLVNGLLVWAVADALAGGVPALCAAALFLLHPLNAEAVAYVSGRADLLVTLGALLALTAALRGWWPVAAVGLVIAAVSKEIGLVALPLVAFSLWAWRPRVAIYGLSALLIIAGAVAGMAGHQVLAWASMTAQNGGTSASWAGYVAVQATALVSLLLRVAWPVGFTIDHDWIVIPVWQQAASVALVLAALGVTGAGWRSHRLAAWACGWVLLSVLPRFLFRQSEGLHEQHLYLGMAAVSVAIGSMVGSWITAANGADCDERRTAESV